MGLEMLMTASRVLAVVGIVLVVLLAFGLIPAAWWWAAIGLLLAPILTIGLGIVIVLLANNRAHGGGG